MSAAFDESNLLVSAANGNQQALERVLLGYYPRLLDRVRTRLPARTAGLLDPEDVLQEALVDVFRGISTFRLGGEGTFAAWLNSIVDHRLQDNLRRLGRKKRGGDLRRIERVGAAASSIADLVALLSDHARSPSQNAAWGEAVRAVQVGLAGLPNEQRAAIVHRYLKQQSIESTATAMRRTPGAVRGLLHRAKRSLRDALGRSTRWFG